MGKSMFTIKGNICSERVRLGRALQKPPITQEDLAKKLQFMGMEDMTGAGVAASGAGAILEWEGMLQIPQQEKKSRRL